MTLEVLDDKGLSVYWDYETTRLNLRAVSGYEVVGKIRSALHLFGPVQSFKTYHDSTNQPLSDLHLELCCSGVTLIDCPSNGRKETIAKTMIVDIIAHAWDHPAPRTIVVITGDRDLAYLIATLRMRKYQVVLISPSGTHTSLTNQASVNLDWTSGIANIDGCRIDMDDSRGGQPSPHQPPSLHLPPSPPPPLPVTTGFSFHYPKTDFLSKAQEIDPPMVDLQGMPTTRGRQKSKFPHSYESEKYNIFGGFGDPFSSPRISNDAYGLGEGPLFSRSQSRILARQVRSDSAPPGIVYSTHSFSRPCSPPEGNDLEGMSSSTKGKQREFPITEPEDIAPQSPLGAKMPGATRSASMTGVGAGFFSNMHPSLAGVDAPIPSIGSSVTSQNSTFSVNQFPPSSAPTSVEPVYVNMTEIPKSSTNIIVAAPQEPTLIVPKSPVVRDTEKVSVRDPSPMKEETSKAISTKDSPRDFLPIRAGPSSTPRFSAIVSPRFQVLVDTLRQHKGSHLKSSLPTLLLTRDPDVYKKAQVNKYGKYIAGAVTAGLVREASTSKGLGVFLTAEYA